jgi:hypothetical protein
LIEEQTTMALATSGGNTAWAAPVYYVFSNGSFYFFSDPASRHIREALTSGQAASTIYAPASSWQEIRGIQMSGVVAELPAGIEAVKVIRAYLRKFPFTKEFFSRSEDLDLPAFSNRFRVRLYRLMPDLVYYLDNGIRFGFRERVVL